MLPNFLIIGAQKAGTRWVKLMSAQHPDCFVAGKEPRYFNDHFQNGLAWYETFFTDSAGQKAIGEKTPGYLWVPSPRQKEFPGYKMRNVPQLVRDFDPGMKLIVTLRDPVKRAISAYYHHMRARRIVPGESILEANPYLGIIDRGFYHYQLSRWFEHFPQKQFLILILKRDIAHRSARTIRHLYRFLNVDESFEPVSGKRRFNRRWGPYVLYLNHYAPALARLASFLPFFASIPCPKVEVSEEEVAQLAELYRKPSARLSKLLDIDLDLWT